MTYSFLQFLRGKKVKIIKIRRDHYEPDKNFINFPNCYGNFNTISAICQECAIKAKCNKLSPPNDIHWCCNPP